MQEGHRVCQDYDPIITVTFHHQITVLLQDMLVVLDERGKEATSQSLADLVAKVTFPLQPTEDIWTPYCT